jgi:bis(5'-nucleosyl)-tetraphosphatase (symmetrical)
MTPPAAPATNGPRAPAPGGAPSRPRVFVGDVQGCTHELDALLAALPFDPATIDLWFAGDLVNRGPDSLGALRRARALGARMVLGNHDLHLLGLAAGTRKVRPDDTLDEVLAAPDRHALLDWLRQQPLVQTWDDLVLVHAGLHPAWDDPAAIARPLEAQIRTGTIPWNDEALSFLTRVRHCDAHGRRPASDRSPDPGFAPWDHFYRGRRIAVCGHWAQRGLVVSERVRGIDTGCVWGNALTAWVAETDRIFSVRAARRYCEPH